VSEIPFPEPPLTDSVVALRGWRESDAAVKASWGQDSLLVRWTGVPADYTEAEARARSAKLEAERRAGASLALAITDVE
jgi:hypothetical protein